MKHWSDSHNRMMRDLIWHYDAIIREAFPQSKLDNMSLMCEFNLKEKYERTVRIDAVLKCSDDVMLGIEIKPYVYDFGNILGQLNEYRSRLDDVTIVLLTDDDRWDEEFEEMGYIVLHPKQILERIKQAKLEGFATTSSSVTEPMFA